jgi:hypothetical protein
MKEKPIYEKPRPKSLGKPKKLSSSQKSKAKSMAKKAGRPYPNMVDNIRAAKMKDGGCIPTVDARSRKKVFREGGKVSAAWTRKEGKNPSGGLNEKGRRSYEKANPGSNLKAPQPKGGSRKNSFCARMGGMKKKLTSKKTANDPNSRINKALKKWNC